MYVDILLENFYQKQRDFPMKVTSVKVKLGYTWGHIPNYPKLYWSVFFLIYCKLIKKAKNWLGNTKEKVLQQLFLYPRENSSQKAN